MYRGVKVTEAHALCYVLFWTLYIWKTFLKLNRIILFSIVFIHWNYLCLSYNCRTRLHVLTKINWSSCIYIYLLCYLPYWLKRTQDFGQLIAADIEFLVIHIVGLCRMAAARHWSITRSVTAGATLPPQLLYSVSALVLFSHCCYYIAGLVFTNLVNRL